MIRYPGDFLKNTIYTRLQACSIACTLNHKTETTSSHLSARGIRYKLNKSANRLAIVDSRNSPSKMARCSENCDQSLNCDILLATKKLSFVIDTLGCKEENYEVRGLRNMISKLACRGRRCHDKMCYIDYMLHEECNVNQECFDRMDKINIRLRRNELEMLKHITVLDIEFNHARVGGASRRKLMTQLEELEKLIDRVLNQCENMIKFIDIYAGRLPPCKKNECEMCGSEYRDAGLPLVYCGAISVVHPDI